MLHARVGQVHLQRSFDLLALLGDAAGELDERLQPASSGPLQPAVEQRERVLERVGVVDGAELLFEPVGPAPPTSDERNKKWEI